MSQEQLSFNRDLHGAIWRYPVRADRGGFPIHHHDELELNIVTTGHCTYEIEGRNVELRTNDLIWLWPGQLHGVRAASRDLRMWILVITDALLTATCVHPHSRALLNRDSPEPPRHLRGHDVQWMQNRCTELSGASPHPDRFNSGLAYLTISAWEMSHAPSDQAVSRVVAQAMSLIDEEPSGRPVPALAEAVGLSVSQLNRLFRATTGVTVTQYRHERQLRAYLDLYGSGHWMSSADAAHAAGFGSYAQFHRVFTRAMGCSPTDYRRRTGGRHL